MSTAWNGGTPAGVAEVAPYELGVRYNALGTITVRSIRVWVPGDAMPLVGRRARLWADGLLIGYASMPEYLPGGWSTHELVAPVVLTPGMQVVASYSTAGNYGWLANAFTGGVVSADSLVVAPQVANGLFTVIPGTLPTNTTGTFYGVDLEYDAGDTTGSNVAPSAVVTVTPSTGYSPLDVVLAVTATDDAPVAGLTYRITWGDGSSDTGGAGPWGHTYATPGAYAVLVVTEDAGGLQDLDAVPVVVLAPPEPSGLLTAEDLAYMRDTQAEAWPTAASLLRRTVTRSATGGAVTGYAAAEPIACRIDGTPDEVPAELAARYEGGTLVKISTAWTLDLRDGDRVEVAAGEVYELVSSGDPDRWATAQPVWARRVARPER